MPNTARQLHAQAETLREEGKILEALQTISQALLRYEVEADIAGFAEALCSQFLIYNHLYQQTKFQPYLECARAAAEASVRIAKKLTDKSGLIIPLFNLAKALEILEDLPAAIENYQQAAQINQKTVLAKHDQNLLDFDIKLHLELCRLENGDKTALEKIEKTIEKLEANKNKNSFHINVLISGVYLKLTSLLKKQNLTQAKKYFKLATDLINSDGRLILRKKQLQALHLE